ncbi:MAG: hypothetical protein JXA42_14930 [Anaerolineales bacterium]|nr:hypothetical protein [Anaerolineales bacterium]
MMNPSRDIPVGRLLRANATGFVLGCNITESDRVSFGGLVRVSTGGEVLDIFGLVYDISYNDDSMVRQVAISGALNEEVLQDQRYNRQIPIEMSVLSVGYRQDNLIHRRIPPRPPLSLDRVTLCSPQEIREFTGKLGYFRLILRQQFREVPVEQLIVAHIVQAVSVRDDNAWAREAAAELIAQLRDDHATLLPLLEALGEAIPGLDNESAGFSLNGIEI